MFKFLVILLVLTFSLSRNSLKATRDNCNFHYLSKNAHSTLISDFVENAQNQIHRAAECLKLRGGGQGPAILKSPILRQNFVRGPTHFGASEGASNMNVLANSNGKQEDLAKHSEKAAIKSTDSQDNYDFENEEWYQEAKKGNLFRILSQKQTAR